MDEGAKRRLVGAAVLVALAVIFVPMLVEEKDSGKLGEPIVIPEKPDFDAAYQKPAAPKEEDMTPPLPIPEPPGGLAPDEQAAIDARAQEPVQEEPVAVAKPAAVPKPAAAQKPASTQASAAAGPKPVPAGTASWVIQVASLGSPEAARKLQDELRGKGYAAFVEQANVSGKRYYRVRVGPEVDRGRADRMAAKLQGVTGNKPLVQSHP